VDGADPSLYAQLGIDDDERAAIHSQAGLGVNTWIWRARVRHFSDWDANWNFSPPANARLPPAPAPQNDDPDDPCERAGSVIGCESRTLGESIPIVGTPFSLNYQSRRQKGYHNRIRFRLSDDEPLPGSFVKAHIEIQAAGRRYEYSQYGLGLNEFFTWTWDGLDAYGRTVHQGTAQARIRVGYEFQGTSTLETETFGAVASIPLPITGDRSARTVTLWTETTVPVRRADPEPLGLGGWTLDAHHTLDNVDTVYFGDGRRQTRASLGYQIDTVAGGGGSIVDGVQATLSALWDINDIALSADGTLFVSHGAYGASGGRIRAVSPEGIITTIAGGGTAGRSDGMDARDAQIWPQRLAIGPDGSVFFSEGGTGSTSINRIWKVEDGVLRLVAGTGAAGPIGCPAPLYCGDGGPAIDAELRWPGHLGILADGTIYFTDNSNRIRRIGPEGVITTSYNDSAGLHGLWVREDGTMVVHRGGMNGIARIEPNGTATILMKAEASPVNVNGDWCEFPHGFSGVIRPLHDDSLLLSCYSKIVRRTPEGALLRLAGADPYLAYGYEGDGGPAIRARLFQAGPMVVSPRGDIFIGDRGNHRVRRLSLPRPSQDGTGLRIVPSSDEVYEFSSTGRQLRTLSGLRGEPRLTFDYDSAGLLTKITEATKPGQPGKETLISRAGSSVTITGPFGHETVLTLANGYLAQVRNPKVDEIWLATHAANGLLTDLADPKGNAHRFDYDVAGRLFRDVDATPGSPGQRLSTTSAGPAYTVAIVSAEGRVARHTIERGESYGDRAIVERRTITHGTGLSSVILKYADGAFKATNPGGRITTVEETAADPRWGTLASFPSKVKTEVGSKSFTRTETRSASFGSGDPFAVTAAAVSTTVAAGGISAITTSAFSPGSPAKWTTTSPHGRQVETELDTFDRVTKVKPLGASPVTLHPVDLRYDNAGRIDQITHGSRVYTVFYNTDGTVAGVTQPEGLGIGFGTHDANGRPQQITLPGSRTLGLTYDKLGNVESVLPPAKPTHWFGFDQTNRLATYVPPQPGNGVTLTPKDTEYSYDMDGFLFLTAQPGGPASYGYDRAGRIRHASALVKVSLRLRRGGTARDRGDVGRGQPHEQLRRHAAHRADDRRAVYARRHLELRQLPPHGEYQHRRSRGANLRARSRRLRHDGRRDDGEPQPAQRALDQHGSGLGDRHLRSLQRLRRADGPLGLGIGDGLQRELPSRRRRPHHHEDRDHRRRRARRPCVLVRRGGATLEGLEGRRARRRVDLRRQRQPRRRHLRRSGSPPLDRRRPDLHLRQQRRAEDADRLRPDHDLYL
jgi:YD repeat-containing protein